MISDSLSTEDLAAPKAPKRFFPRLTDHWFSRLGPRSLQQKLILGYGLAFSVSIVGIVIGKTVADDVEQRAIEIQAEATEDVENISALKSSLLELIVAESHLLALLEQDESTAPERIRAEIAHLFTVHQTLRRRWQIFKSEDEFQYVANPETANTVTEEEAIIAGRILATYTDTLDEYIQAVDAMFDRISLSNLQAEDLDTLPEEIRLLQRNRFIAEIDRFIIDITNLAAATEEEYAEATEKFREATHTRLRILLVSTLLSGLLGLMLVTIISRFLLRPLDTLTTTVQKSIQEANFDLRVPVINRDETGVLSQSFNVYMDFVSKLLSERESANQELQNTLTELHRTQGQIIQSEKMSSLGQLVAGVAHEINNPVNFIHGNLSHVRTYAEDLLGLLATYEQHYSHPVDEVQHTAEAIDLDFLKTDLPQVLDSMKLGSDRIREIVLALRNFARLNEAEIKPVDIHEGIDNTLLILGHRLKASPDRPSIEVVKTYGPLPQVECCPGLINQVFMNILSNAIDALEDAHSQSHPAHQTTRKITVQTTCLLDDWVEIAIADNGNGITPALQKQIFDPFFTTKPVGKGTGMGMSISYQIVTERHGGRLRVESSPGQGTQFTIQLPIRHPFPVS